MEHSYEQLFPEYARLLIDFGAGMLPGQILTVQIEPENFLFARVLSEEAMKAGAEDVIVIYTDPYVDKARSANPDHNPLEDEQWKADTLRHYLENGAIDISFLSPHPNFTADMSFAGQQKMIRYQNDLRNIVREAIWRGQNWLYAALPNREWAEAIYPELNSDDALTHLWEEILRICRVDGQGNARAAWIDFYDSNFGRIKSLKKLDIDYVHAWNELGTDITVGILPGADWLGGVEKETRMPGQNQCNLPSYEIATTADRNRIDGVVVSSMPLHINGSVIDRFRLTLKSGRIVDYHAEKGGEILKGIIESEENMHYMGEFALVETGNAIQQAGVVFGNTLLDENAACHMAIGMGIADMLPGAEDLTADELIKAGVNIAGMHVDFMFGTADTNVDAVCRDGRTVSIFRNGRFCNL